MRKFSGPATGPAFLRRMLLPGVKTGSRSLPSGFSRKIKELIPKTAFGDRLFGYIRFLSNHRRLPTRQLRFNDRIFATTYGDEILRPERAFTSDKYLVKIFVAGVIGEKYAIPTLSVLRTEAEIDGHAFTCPCVVKGTHGSGDCVILRRPSDPDRAALKKTLRASHYARGRERNYKYAEHRLIVEPIIFDGNPVDDYKVFCWNGAPKFIMYASDRNRNFFRTLYDTNWAVLDHQFRGNDTTNIVPAPANLPEMLEVSRRLAALFDLVRIDLYSDGHELYVGEISHVHRSAREKFDSEADERGLSALLFS